MWESYTDSYIIMRADSLDQSIKSNDQPPYLTLCWDRAVHEKPPGDNNVITPLSSTMRGAINIAARNNRQPRGPSPVHMNSDRAHAT